MYKIIVTSAVFLVIGITLAAKLPSKCSSQLLPEVDINYFKFCDSKTGTTYLNKCEYGSGFIRNGTASGCVPFEKWPKQCIAQVPIVPKCTGKNLVRPSSATNPNEYYICSGEGASPSLISCPEGKGFLNVPGTLGCAYYKEWRSIKNCPE